MSATKYRSRIVRGVPVVTSPAEIDATGAGQLRAALVEWRRRGHITLVVDMTGTQFCDSAGLRELVWAHKRAVADGGGLRLVIPAEGAVMRVFTVTGLDRLIPHFTGLEHALAQEAAAVRPRLVGPVRSAAAAASPPAHAWQHILVAGGRGCDHCGALFVPQREHARFCSPACRAAWNRAHMGDPAAETSALAWSIAAMSDATARLPAVRVWDQARALAAIGEVVWRITMVDATLVRHYPAIYDAVLATQSARERQLVRQTLAGLRFVRNWIGRGAELDEAVETGGQDPGSRRITLWMWSPIPEPALAFLPPRSAAWEMARYQAYQAYLAGHVIGETLGRAVRFLTHTGAIATSTTVDIANTRS